MKTKLLLLSASLVGLATLLSVTTSLIATDAELAIRTTGVSTTLIVTGKQ